MQRKHTPWKKSRKFGDVYGGRTRPKIADNIFDRCHDLDAPEADRDLPILLQDNPSRDFYFPISAVEALSALRELPNYDVSGITHIWCRRLRKKEYDSCSQPLAQFVCGSGVRAIVLYPWSRDRKRTFSQVSDQSLLNEMRRLDFVVTKSKGVWSVSATEKQLRLFYINLLFHEVGHHVDWYYRHFSAANRKATEDAANQYANEKSQEALGALDRIQEFRSWDA